MNVKWPALARRMAAACTLGWLLGISPAVFAQVTVNTLNTPNSIGRLMTATISIDYTRSSASAATITVPIPSVLQVNPPAPPAGCVVRAGPQVECAVPAGGAGSTGSVQFDVIGAAVGSFNLTATSGASSASNPGTVRSSGDLTLAKTRTTPAGTPVGGQTITFRLTPNIAASGDDLPAGAGVTITDNLPGATGDFNVTTITATAPASCNNVAQANTSRVLTCTINGPLTAAALNALAINVSGFSSSSGGYVNNAGIASAVSANPYVDRSANNNTVALPYTVNPGTDLLATGTFVATALVGSNQTLTLTYRNAGPSDAPAGGTVAATLPTGFTAGVLPGGCARVGSVVTCTAGAVASGNTQSFAIPVTMPAVAQAGNIPVTVSAPAAISDANPANNAVLLPYSVQVPNGDLRLTKTKSAGPLPAGGTITNTLTVSNPSISTVTFTAGNGAQPLRVLDDMSNSELFVSASAAWTCSDGGINSAGAGLRRVSCVFNAAGSLAPSASTVLTLNTRVDPALAVPTTLSNTACTGKQALNRLGLNDSNGPQPADANTANDCSTQGVNGTPVVSGEAAVTIVKESSRDNAAWFDAVGTPAAIAGGDEFGYWRMTITTPSAASQKTIPTLQLTDNLPGVLNQAASTGLYLAAHITPAMTVTFSVTAGSAGGGCPATVAAGASTLICSFTNVQPGTTMVVTVKVKRPFGSGLLTNTATLTSANAVLSGTTADSAAWQVEPRVDPMVSSKVMTPAQSATSPRVGQTVTFTVTARNSGPNPIATGDMTLSDTLDTAKYTLASVSGTGGLSCSSAAGVASCTNTSTMTRGNVRTMSIVARIIKPAVLPPGNPVFGGEVNTAVATLAPGVCEWKDEAFSNASVSSACNDAQSRSNNAASITYDVKLPLIDLQQRKVRQLPAGQSAFSYGDALTYRMRIQNIGPSRAENVVMTDNLSVPAGFTPVSVQATSVNGTASEPGFSLDATKSGSVSCTLTSPTAITCVLSSTLANNYLDPGNEVNFLLGVTYSGSANGVNSFGNRAVACADETVAYESVGACSTSTSAGPTGVNNNTASANDVVFPKAELSITQQTLTPSPVSVNQTVQYALSVRNEGPADLAQIRVTDKLPANFEWLGTTLSLGTFAQAAAPASTVSCAASPPTLTAPGQSQTLNCQLNAAGNTALFPGNSSPNNTVTLTVTARPKLGFFSGPYSTNVVSTSTVAVGKDAFDQDLAVDGNPNNNTANSPVQVTRTSISGRVYADANLNRAPDGGEASRPSVPLTLSGTDVFGGSVTVVVSSAASGSFTFQVAPGTYTLTKGADPAGFADFASNVPGTLPFGAAGGAVSTGTPASGAAGTAAAANRIDGIGLAAGDVATGYSFGEVSSAASISGQVFVDANNDGVFNGVDSAVPGVTVALSGVDANGSAVTRTAVTDNGGVFAFAGLLPGTYDITEVAQPTTANGAQLPAGFATTLPGKTMAGTGGTPGTASSVASAPSRITGIQLAANQASVNNAFGELLPAGISGRVFLDSNNDGLFNAADSALNGVTLTLSGTDDVGTAVSASVSTSGSGTYTFSDLRPGTYTVTEASQPAGTSNGITSAGTVSNGGTPGTASAVGVQPSRISSTILTSGAQSTNNNFAEVAASVAPGPGSISGKVWIDTNNNGSVEPSEPGINGVSLVLTGTDSNGTAVSRTVVTSGNGDYVFASLAPGSYRITQPQQPAAANGAVLPAGVSDTLSGQTVPGNGASQRGTGTPPGTLPSSIGTVQLLPGESSTGNNFAELVASSLGGFVYLDVNKSGMRDSGDTPIASVTITLTGTDDQGQAVNRSSTTDAQGAYRFDGLRPGTYTLTQPQQPVATANAETSPGAVSAGGIPGTATPRATLPSAISGIRIVLAGTASPDNNFGEAGSSPDLVVTKTARSAYFTENNTAYYDLAVRNAGAAPTAGDYVLYDVLPRTSPQVWRIDSAAGAGWACTVAADGLSVACRSSMVLAPGAVHPASVAVAVSVLEGAKARAPLRNLTVVRGGGESPAVDPFPNVPVDPTDPLSPSDAGLRGLTPAAPPCVDQVAQATQSACVRDTPVRLSAALGGRVWLDGVGLRNTYDAGDKNYTGWRVLVVDPALMDANSRGIPAQAIVRTGITGTDGTYRINNLEPGRPYWVYFQDPEGRTIFAGAVNGERRVAQSCSRSATGSDGFSRNPYLDVTLPEGSVSNEITCNEQSLPIDPNGVVYDSQSRQPVAGAIVTFKPEGSCLGYDPTQYVIGYNAYGLYDAQGNPRMTTDTDGFYKFLLAANAPASCLFRLEVQAPAGFVSPSALIGPSGALQTPVGVGTVFNVQQQTTPPAVTQPTTYHLLLLTGSSHNDVFNNHIPLDALSSGLLRIQKTGSVRVVELGDSLEYTIGVTQWSGPPLAAVQVVDTLPAGFRYIPGTFRIAGTVQPDPKGGVGPVLTFSLPNLQAGATLSYTYRVRVGVGAQEGNGTNRARANARSGTTPVDSNLAEYTVRVEGGVFTNDGCVVGKVYVDCNGNHVQDPGELGIPGVRLYFNDGFFMVSDSEGKYSVCGRQPRTWMLKVDPATLPRGSRLGTTSNRNVGDPQSLFVDLKNGELHRADFAEASCSNTVLEQVKARRTRGEVSAPETEREGAPALKFQSQSLTAPRDTTTSAQQPLLAPRDRGGHPIPGPLRDAQQLPVPQLPAGVAPRDAAR